jgi:hypothetical protein
MESDLLPNVRGHVQALRQIWSSKIEEQEKRLQSTSIDSRSSLHDKHKLSKIQPLISSSLEILNSKSLILTPNTDSKPMK